MTDEVLETSILLLFASTGEVFATSNDIFLTKRFSSFSLDSWYSDSQFIAGAGGIDFMLMLCSIWLNYSRPQFPELPELSPELLPEGWPKPDRLLRPELLNFDSSPSKSYELLNDYTVDSFLARELFLLLGF